MSRKDLHSLDQTNKVNPLSAGIDDDGSISFLWEKQSDIREIPINFELIEDEGNE